MRNVKLMDNPKFIYAFSKDQRVTIAGVIVNENLAENTFTVALGLAKKVNQDTNLKKRAKAISRTRAMRKPFSQVEIRVSLSSFKPKPTKLEPNPAVKIESPYQALVRHFHEKFIPIANTYSQEHLPEHIQSLYGKNK